MKKLIIFFVFTAIALINFMPSYAQESESTDSAEVKENDSVREKVQQKLEFAKNSPTARIGTITDISELTLQVENEQDEIQLVSIDEEKTKFISVGKTTTTVSFEDLAIGDFVVAMGFENGEGVLEAVRVLITSALDLPNRTITYGTVSSIDGKEVVVETIDGEFLLTFPRRWKGPEISDLEEGGKVIAVTVDTEGTNEVRTIDILHASEETLPTTEEE